MNTLSGTQVARLSGLSYRQIDYWCRRGVITPEFEGNGSGTQRRFSRRQADVLRVLYRVRNAGLGLDRIKPLARFLEALPSLDGWLIVTLDGQPPFVVDDDLLVSVLGLCGEAVVVELSGEGQAEPERERRRERDDARSG